MLFCSVCPWAEAGPVAIGTGHKAKQTTKQEGWVSPELLPCLHWVQVSPGSLWAVGVRLTFLQGEVHCKTQNR